MLYNRISAYPYLSGDEMAMQYDENTVAILKAEINARNALDAIAIAKRAVRSIPVIYPKSATNAGNLDTLRTKLREAEAIVYAIATQASADAHEIGL